MLVLFETSAGFSLFKLADDSKLKNPDNLYKDFQTADAARKLVKLKAFKKFANTAEALADTTAIGEGKVGPQLKEFLEKELKKGETLAVADAKLGSSILKKMGIECVFDAGVQELMRGLRSQIESLLSGDAEIDHKSMTLGLAHSLSRYKLKFSPDKIDTMIVQAIALLDDLDKELNTYCMRVREWYGWHFPELSPLIADHVQFARVVKKMGMRTNAATTDLSDILEEEVEPHVREVAQISMGTEISMEDIFNIQMLADQIISIAEYRTELYDYLKNRMMAIAPNLTVLVGELVGARLIAHAGSLINLAKQPASTVQILGAEKALFRALKTKHETPKYGLIYHASLVGQAQPRHKGRISRVLAAKTALSIRVDALGDTTEPNIGVEGRTVVENRLRQLEGRAATAQSGSGKSKTPIQAFVKPAAQFTATKSYNASADATAAIEEKKESKKEKRKERDSDAESDSDKKKKKEKKEKKSEEKSEKKEKKEEKKDKSEKSDKKEKKEKRKDREEEKSTSDDDKAAKKAKKEAKKATKESDDKKEKKEKKKEKKSKD